MSDHDPVLHSRKQRLFPIARLVARALFSLLFRLRVRGRENIPPHNAFVLLPKHQRWEDIPLLGLATPRSLHYVAKQELFSMPFFGWFLTALGGIPLNRSRLMESRQSLRFIQELLGEEGEGLVVFPEGTYYRNRMGPGHVGLIRMIMSRSKVPFIPTGVRYEARGRHTEVQIKFGRPFYRDSSFNADLLVDQIMMEIARLSGYELAEKTSKSNESSHFSESPFI
ncbi:MAG: 1-acyl-sn-glycerol-3-phosphate acyltransferase [Deltaproteobacteria bacterium]|nr:1-acyl-sn-glycerol-3-phosphate acyltransferase [Deltaproteobacteria bacterium]